MEPYQIRVAKEREELQERAYALFNFLESDALYALCSEQEQELLTAQYHAMRTYLCILDQRIKLF